MNKTERIINALQEAGYKVRYTTTKWGRGFKYDITGIGRANYKYSEHALSKGESLVGSGKRKYTLSEKALAQRAAAREARRKIRLLSKEEQELYREMRKLYNKKENFDKFHERYPGATKAPSIDTILKLPPGRRKESLERRIDILKGLAPQSDIDALAEALERAGRTTGVDVYDLVAKLRSGDYDMPDKIYQEFRNVLIDSGNPNYWEKQVDPTESIQQVVNKLDAFLSKQ